MRWQCKASRGCAESPAWAEPARGLEPKRPRKENFVGKAAGNCNDQGDHERFDHSEPAALQRQHQEHVQSREDDPRATAGRRAASAPPPSPVPPPSRKRDSGLADHPEGNGRRARNDFGKLSQWSRPVAMPSLAASACRNIAIRLLSRMTLETCSQTRAAPRSVAQLRVHVPTAPGSPPGKSQQLAPHRCAGIDGTVRKARQRGTSGDAREPWRFSARRAFVLAIFSWHCEIRGAAIR